MGTRTTNPTPTRSANPKYCRASTTAMCIAMLADVFDMPHTIALPRSTLSPAMLHRKGCNGKSCSPPHAPSSPVEVSPALHRCRPGRRLRCWRRRRTNRRAPDERRAMSEMRPEILLICTPMIWPRRNHELVGPSKRHKRWNASRANTWDCVRRCSMCRQTAIRSAEHRPSTMRRKHVHHGHVGNNHRWVKTCQSCSS